MKSRKLFDNSSPLLAPRQIHKVHKNWVEHSKIFETNSSSNVHWRAPITQLLCEINLDDVGSVVQVAAGNRKEPHIII